MALDRFPGSHGPGYPAGSDSTAIRRTILPKSRLVRWLSASKSRQVYLDIYADGKTLWVEREDVWDAQATMQKHVDELGRVTWPPDISGVHDIQQVSYQKTDAHRPRANTQNGATQEEIARVVGCSVDPLHRRFAEVIKKGGAELNMRLRRSQVKAAVKQTKPKPGQTKLT